MEDLFKISSKGLLFVGAILTGVFGGLPGSFGGSLEQASPRALISPPPQMEDSIKTFSIPRNYLIGPEDVLEVSVWKSPELSATVTVRPDGMISLPLLGELRASGKTPMELQEDVAERLKVYKQEPTVSIIVKEINSQVFYILGEIGHPGKYPLKNETTVLQAIALAGGFTQWAEKDNVLVLRKKFSQIDEQRITVRFSKIVSGKDTQTNIVLKPGDTIIVP